MLKFSDATYGTFFAEELNVNTDEEKYYAEGGSKGKRLRYFQRTEKQRIGNQGAQSSPDQVETVKAKVGNESARPVSGGSHQDNASRSQAPPQPARTAADSRCT